MLDIQNTETAGVKTLKLIGRIDGISSPMLDKSIKDLAISGERQLITDLQDVNYISSAGLRVFLTAQQVMTKAGGELMLYNLNEQILSIFKTAGFTRIFKIIHDISEISALNGVSNEEEQQISNEIINNISFKILKTNAKPSETKKFGNFEKLSKSEYSEADVVTLAPKELKYGIGLGALGDGYTDFKDYFGETAVINCDFFVYPAVKKQAVDYIIPPPDFSFIKYQFLNFLGFKGDFKYIINFEGVNGFVNSNDLFQSILKLNNSKLYGIVFFAESKGLWGMNLKQVPIVDNKSGIEDSIFSEQNFPNWLNFPVEASDFNSIIVGTGFIHNFTELPVSLKDYFASNSNWHIHTAVFEKGIINRNIENFNEELNRILTELEPQKVVHLLGRSVLSSGCIGLIELEV
ncbi:MAG TPA: STAS domain-containing protein [Candidatus Kapabacteria bacterium]|nr:STAS domain-containing protein [Candidatus Kapabacteria bacterium]